jgi:simple sugar transport system ATP-binding protein
MVGGELPKPDTRESTVRDEVLLEASGITVMGAEGRPVIEDISLTLHRGEIVGIAGVEGNGQTELIDAVMGIMALSSGSIRLLGNDIASMPTRQRREAGIGYIPQDRQRDGLVLPAPLWENVMLGHQGRAPFSRNGFIDRKGAQERTAEIVRRFGVRTPGVEVPALALSGGNQQKLIVGREMTAEPAVLVAAQPTRGIDVGAQAAIWDEIRRARRDGLGVLLVSADLEELIGLSDTLLVIYRGRIVATLDPGTVTPTELGSYMTGAALEDGAA